MRISDWSSDVCSSDLPHPPIWLGGFSDAVLKRIGEHCDGWITVYHNDQVAFGEGSGPENVKKSRAKLHQFAEAAGREVSDFEISAILTPESEVESVKIYEYDGVDRVALTLPDIETIDAERRAVDTF